MYICRDCGRLFDRTHFATSTDYTTGIPFDVREEFCPFCYSEDYGEAVTCEVCGEYHEEEELINGVCEDCIDKCRHDVDMCFEIGMDNRSEVKLNSFLLSMYDERDIEAILIKYLKATNPNIDCSEFIDNDISWFAKQLVKQEAQA